MPVTRKVKVSGKPIQSKGKLSLKELLDTSKGEEEQGFVEELRGEFSQDDLYDKWMMFARTIKNKDLDLYSTLTANRPLLKDNFIIELKIYNSAQQDDINKQRGELLGYLRKQLGNTVLNLELVIDTESEPKGYYTPQDKYKKLVEINPKIDELRKKFGLGF